MANPTEICIVKAGGQSYDIWETVEFTHANDPVFDHVMLTVAEPSSNAKTLSALKLKPGDKAQVYLAGQLVLDGMVYLRQAAYDRASHAVQIGISSYGVSVMPSTVDVKPGQYKNQTVQQIASAVFGPVGVKFKIVGNPEGADIPFPRFSEHMGETRFNCIERACRQRNLHMIDDGQGGVQAFRGPFGASGQTLKEGFNILHARLLLKNNDEISDVLTRAQNYNQDSGDDNAKVSGNATVPNATTNRPMKFAAEEPHTQKTIKYRANQEVDFITYQHTDGDITVQGWLCPDGSLWARHVLKLVTLDSPMLIPDGNTTFMIKGVTHRQSSQTGTTTSVFICDKDGLGLTGSTPVQGGG